MFKFVPTTVGTLGKKRKQTQRACEQCCKRKKRCEHLPEEYVARPRGERPTQELATSDPASTQLHSNLSRSGETPYQENAGTTSFTGADGQNSTRGPADTPSGQIAGSGNDDVHGDSGSNFQPAASIDKLDSRFIGDLNPEGQFRAATSPATARDASLNGSIGTWLARRLSSQPPSSGPLASQQQKQAPDFLYGFSPLIQKILLTALEEECLKTVPPPQNMKTLRRVYFEKMQPILPLVDEARLDSLQSTDPAYILLQQGICIAASLNINVENALILPSSALPMGHREFGKRLFSAMRISIEMGMVTNKVVLTQALALMSFFSDGPDGGETSSQLCGRAVQYVHVLGLHVQRQPNINDDKNAVTLLCSIWALDRMNAALHGCPVLMHERDLGRDMQWCFEQQVPSFRLLLRVLELLDKTIQLYRPSSLTSDWDNAFPSFETVLIQSGATNIQTNLLGTSPCSHMKIGMTLLSLHYGIALPSPRNWMYLGTTSMLKSLSSHFHIGI
jgi:hypothetical protein